VFEVQIRFCLKREEKPSTLNMPHPQQAGKTFPRVHTHQDKDDIYTSQRLTGSLVVVWDVGYGRLE